MPKEQIKRMDWFKSYPRDFHTSLSYRMLSPAQRGAFRDLLDLCWINFPNVSCPAPESLVREASGTHPRPFRGASDVHEACIREACGIRSQSDWNRIMPAVLAKFELRDGRLYNAKLREQLDETLEDTVNARIRRMSRVGETPAELEPDSSLTTVRLQSDDKRREEKIKEEIEENTVSSAMSELEANQTLVENNLGGLKPGQPGFFRRGQYPGTKPKAVFAWVAKAWSNAIGDAAFLRYPSKFPQAWEDLCGQKSGDLIVPAFELWIQKEAIHCKFDWPLSEFVKVAEKYMAKIIPLNTVKPELTKAAEDATVKAARAAHAKVWDVPAPADEPEADVSELFR